MKQPRIGYERGWIGAFTRDQAEGAIPNGTVIVKCASEDEDGNPNGALGVVLGSIDGMLFDREMCKRFDARFMYWVEWQMRPRAAVAVVDRKIKKATAQ